MPKPATNFQAHIVSNHQTPPAYSNNQNYQTQTINLQSSQQAQQVPHTFNNYSSSNNQIQSHQSNQSNAGTILFNSNGNSQFNSQYNALNNNFNAQLNFGNIGLSNINKSQVSSQISSQSMNKEQTLLQRERQFDQNNMGNKCWSVGKLPSR
jgi:hypothetical protein